MASAPATEPLIQRARRFAQEHSSLLTVLGVFVVLLGLLSAYKIFTADRKISVHPREITDFDSQNAADDLAARHRAAVVSEQSSATEGEPQLRMAVIPDKEVVGLSAPNKTPEQLLNQLASGPEDNYAPVSLSNSDLELTISPIQTPGPNLSVSSSTLDEIDERNKSAKLSAPVSQLIFRDGASYAEFRRLHPSGGLPQLVDFGKSCVVVLISVSDFPSKVFEIVSFGVSGSETVVKYRINPMAALEGGSDRYAFALLDSSSGAVRLEQQ